MLVAMNFTTHDSILDIDHLRTQTAGDESLERELLTLFERQCVRLRTLIGDGSLPIQRADAAHTLKGSARSIGAWRLASSAERLESGLRGGADETAVASLLSQFDEAIMATRGALAELHNGRH